MGFTSTSSNAKLLREIQRSLREVAVSEAGLIEATNSQIAATIASSRTDARLINVDGLNLHTETVGGHTHLIRWRDARIEFITDTANQVATITVGYYHLRGEGVLDFATWDALR